MLDDRQDNGEGGSTYNKVELPTLLNSGGKFDSPLATVPSLLPSALDAASKTLTAVDAIRTARILATPEAPSPAAMLSVALFLYSIAPSWAKPPFVYKYYEGGFEREYHLSELYFSSQLFSPLMIMLALPYMSFRSSFPELSKFDATKLISSEDAAKLFNSLIATIDKTQGYLESALEVANSSNWKSALLHDAAMVIRAIEAGKSADELVVRI